MTARRSPLVSLLFALATAVTGSAQEAETFYVSPYWGGSLRSTAPNDLSSRTTELRIEQRFQIGARFGYRVSERLAIETAYRYNPNNSIVIKLNDAPFGPFEFENLFSSHALSGDFVYFLTRKGTFRPFVTAGAGAELFRTARNESVTSFEWHAAGGVEWALRPTLGLRVGIRWSVLTDVLESGESDGAPDFQLGLVIPF